MNKDQTKEAIYVMQAYVDGEEIEVIDRDDPNAEWKPYSDRFDWDFDCHKYRVKPKPKKYTALVDEFGNVVAINQGDYVILKNDELEKPSKPGYRIIELWEDV